MKADEVRLYALRGGLKKQAVCYTHFHSNKVFRGDHRQIITCAYARVLYYHKAVARFVLSKLLYLRYFKRKFCH